MDANLAEADMESFRTEDIHALLSNLPPITDHLSQEVTLSKTQIKLIKEFLNFNYDYRQIDKAKVMQAYLVRCWPNSISIVR